MVRGSDGQKVGWSFLEPSDRRTVGPSDLCGVPWPVVIREEDFVASLAGALQYISYYHPRDYIRALGAAYERRNLARRA